MEKFFLLIIASFMVHTSMHALPPQGEVTEAPEEENEFWPPDMVPHPHPPGSEPSGPSKPVFV